MSLDLRKAKLGAKLLQEGLDKLKETDITKLNEYQADALFRVLPKIEISLRELAEVGIKPEEAL